MCDVVVGGRSEFCQVCHVHYPVGCSLDIVFFSCVCMSLSLLELLALVSSNFLAVAVIDDLLHPQIATMTQF